jgi:diguanylate cyclase
VETQNLGSKAKATIARLPNRTRCGFLVVFVSTLLEIGGLTMDSLSVINKKVLIRDTLNTIWIIIGLYVIATSIEIFFTSYDRRLFLQGVILYPLIKFLTVMIVVELYIKHFGKYMEYIVIVGITAITAIIVMSIYQKVMLMILLVFPVLVSMFFYSKKLIRFSIFISIFTFLLIYLNYEPIKSNMDTSDLLIVICILVGVALLIYSLMKHSDQIMIELLRTTKEKNDLFSRNIQMERLNRMDPVTELYNHRSFHEHLDSIVSMSSMQELIVHVAVLDIDNFKQINDTYGHRAGDSVIIEVARQIKFFSVGDDFPSRYGGEEFGIITVGTSEEDFIKRVENIRESIANTSFTELDGRSVTISIGVQKLLPGMTKEEIFKGADASLYTAKRTGKNKTVINK